MAGKSLRPIDSESRPLTPRQRRIVDHIVATGQGPYQAEAELGTSATNIYRELRKPHVRKYLADTVRERIGYLAPIALHVQGQLLQSDSDHVRAAVSESLLNRALGKAVERRQVAVQGQINVNIDLTGD